MSALEYNLADKQPQARGNTCKAKMYLNQDYEALRSQCLSQGKLFCDPFFPVAPESLGFKELGPNSDKTKGVTWKRPGELYSKPQFITEGAACADVCQGKLGDCWLMSAIASLTLDKDILARVIYPEQNFTDKYAGIFHFQLWQYGEWVDVVVDDRLPTKDGKLLFVKSKEQTEFWSALLEKAYAKVNGCYENLSGGYASEAHEDFTGGIAESYTLSKAPPNLFNIMKKALRRGSLLNTYISASDKEKESQTKERLVKRHAYSITAATEVQVSKSLVQLVRLRNPWGRVEWCGPWSDGSKEWDQVLPEDNGKLCCSADDGEFWMAYADFIQQYTMMDICNLNPDSACNDAPGCWNVSYFEGTWKKGTSAGGCRNYSDTFSTNPQFWVKLDIDSDGDKKCSVIVALMQKGARQAKQKGIEAYSIGFYIYKVPDKVCIACSSGLVQSEVVGILGEVPELQYKGMKNIRLGGDDLKSPVGKAGFNSTREVCQRFSLPLAQYVIIPATFEPNQETDFLLRVFSEK